MPCQTQRGSVSRALSGGAWCAVALAAGHIGCARFGCGRFGCGRCIIHIMNFAKLSNPTNHFKISENENLKLWDWIIENLIGLIGFHILFLLIPSAHPQKARRAISAPLFMARSVLCGRFDCGRFDCGRCIIHIMNFAKLSNPTNHFKISENENLKLWDWIF